MNLRRKELAQPLLSMESKIEEQNQEVNQSLLSSESKTEIQQNDYNRALVARFASGISGLPVDLKHSSMQQTSDGEVAIRIDTTQANHYRHLLESLTDELEEKSPTYIKSLIDSLESMLNHSRTVLKVQEEKLGKHQKEQDAKLAISIHISELLAEQNVCREDLARDLRLKQKELRESILLLKAGIKKRKKPIQILMYGIMAGTAVYTIVNTIEYFSYKNELNGELNQLSAEYTYLLNTAQSLANDLNNTFYNWYCANDPFGGSPSGSALCTNRASSNECWDHGPQDGGICVQYWPWAYPAVNGIDLCAPIITQWSSSLGNLTANANRQDTASYELIHSSDIYYSWIGNAGTFFLIFSLCGEFAPLVIVAITLLTNVFNNCYASPRRTFDLSKAEHKQVLDTADKYNVAHVQSSYPMLMRNLENELTETTVQLTHFDKAANLRTAFLNGMKEVDAKKAPIRKLFHGSDSIKLCQPKIAAKIFGFAGISVNQLNRHVKKEMRTAFESGAHVKNGVPIPTQDGDVTFNPLFNFFNRLRNERAEFKTQGSVAEFNLFKELTTVKRFTERGGNAHHQKDVLRNIYEFAGLTAKRRLPNGL